MSALTNMPHGDRSRGSVGGGDQRTGGLGCCHAGGRRCRCLRCGRCRLRRRGSGRLRRRRRSGAASAPMRPRQTTPRRAHRAPPEQRASRTAASNQTTGTHRQFLHLFGAHRPDASRRGTSAIVTNVTSARGQWSLSSLRRIDLRHACDSAVPTPRFALRLRSQISTPVTANSVGRTPQRNTRTCQIAPRVAAFVDPADPLRDAVAGQRRRRGARLPLRSSTITVVTLSDCALAKLNAPGAGSAASAGRSAARREPGHCARCDFHRAIDVELGPRISGAAKPPRCCGVIGATDDSSSRPCCGKPR